jgi:nitrogen regulatory protein PII
MKRIEAIIKPFKLEAVKEALTEIGVGGVTVMEVKGFGRQRGHSDVYRGSEYTTDFVPKVMLVIFTSDEMAVTVADTIAEAAKTGKIGDGKIAVSDITEMMRVRTGERGSEAC